MVYITILDKVNILEDHRGPQHRYQLCTYWVGKLFPNGHAADRADHYLGAMHSLCFSSPNGNGRIHLCRMIIETNSSHSVKITNTMLQGKLRADLVEP